MLSFVFLVSRAISIYSWALIIYILMSWFPGARESKIGEFLGRISEPYLEIFRRVIPPLGMFDFSPIVALLVLELANVGIFQLYVWFF